MSNSQVTKAFSSLILINSRECISRSRCVYHCLKNRYKVYLKRGDHLFSTTCIIRFTTPTTMKLLGISGIVYTATLNEILVINAPFHSLANSFNRGKFPMTRARNNPRSSSRSSRVFFSLFFSRVPVDEAITNSN